MVSPKGQFTGGRRYEKYRFDFEKLKTEITQRCLDEINSTKDELLKSIHGDTEEKKLAFSREFTNEMIESIQPHFVTDQLIEQMCSKDDLEAECASLIGLCEELSEKLCTISPGISILLPGRCYSIIREITGDYSTNNEGKENLGALPILADDFSRVAGKLSKMAVRKERPMVAQSQAKRDIAIELFKIMKKYNVKLTGTYSEDPEECSFAIKVLKTIFDKVFHVYDGKGQKVLSSRKTIQTLINELRKEQYDLMREFWESDDLPGQGELLKKSNRELFGSNPF